MTNDGVFLFAMSSLSRDIYNFVICKIQKRQFVLTDVICELERWMKIRDVIDEVFQFNAATLCSSDDVIYVALV